MKEYMKAIEDCSKAIHLNHNHDWAYANLALVLSTCPKDNIRDGKREVQDRDEGMQAVQMEESQSSSHPRRAYAETRDFNNAVKWQKKAIEMGFDDHDEQEKARKRLRRNCMRTESHAGTTAIDRGDSPVKTKPPAPQGCRRPRTPG